MNTSKDLQYNIIVIPNMLDPKDLVYQLSNYQNRTLYLM